MLIANLLTEGSGMRGYTAGDAARQVADVIERPVDVIIANNALPSQAVLERYASEHKMPLPLGDVPEGCEVVEGSFWRRDIARHHRPRLAYAVWTVLSKRLL